MNEYTYRVLTHNEAMTLDNARNLKYFVHTYGCQMNVRESEQLSGQLEEMGYVRAAQENEADLILYNTCCVRENAENKIFGNLGYLKFYKEQNRSLIIAVCGCMAQQPHIFEQLTTKHRYVDVVFGTANHARFPELLWRHIETGRQAADISDAPQTGTEADESNKTLITRGHAYKAGVNVMYGCNNFCTYCIVPYVRGRERSRLPEDIINEAKALADDGVKEIMLLGQNVNAYGAGLAEPVNFAQLLRRVNEIDGLARIRFMTSHPKDFSDELIAAVRDCEKVCKSVHLPLQSGSTRILHSMNRRYNKDTYLSLAKRIQAAIPNIALSTDIIVGFPGETEADFSETLDVIKQVRFAGVFTFLYSKRTGTPAASMPDEVPADVASERFKRLTASINPILLEKNQQRVGTVLTVMAEDEKPGVNGTLTGRADDNTLVHFSAAHPVQPGDLVDVTIKEAKTFYLTGKGAELPHA